MRTIVFLRDVPFIYWLGKQNYQKATAMTYLFALAMIVS